MHDMSKGKWYCQSNAALARHLCLASLTILIAACNKSDRPPTTAERLSSVQQKQETQPDFYVPRKTVDYMTDMKNLKDAPAKPDTLVAPVKTAAAKAPEPVVAAPVETKPAPPPVTATPAPAKATPAQQTPSTAAAPAANVVASAAPSVRPAAPAQDSSVVNVISRVQPEFPRDAIKAGVESGSVQAKLSINAAGDVTDVTILQAQPVRVFDRSVKQALSRWKFNAGANNRTYETQIAFSAN